MAIFLEGHMEYRQFYNPESYLLQTVRSRFERDRCLSARDFFCIVIWKANRAKGKIADKLRQRSGHKNLEEAVRLLTTDIAKESSAKERLRCLSDKQYQHYTHSEGEPDNALHTFVYALIADAVGLMIPPAAIKGLFG